MFEVAYTLVRLNVFLVASLQINIRLHISL